RLHIYAVVRRCGGSGDVRAGISSNDPGPLAALRRHLKALTAVARDSGATEAERANAAALRRRMEQRLDDAGAPAGDWTDNAFRLGRMAKEIKKTRAPAAPMGDTDH